ncbi:DUF7311 family protein [Haloplanus halophilus]|uniref:DUF7311 family protein n=1 Tax=Haloplanus halophilus TaxID=2949993 RepID=UPI00203EE66C|nr:hypothetical protein [Haloplanus sp. GDY1]
MIRVVLSVLLAVALLAVAVPGVDEGRRARTATELGGVTDRVERAVRSLLAREDPTRPGVTGARRIVRYRLPSRSWVAAGATLRIDGDRDRIGYRIGDRPPRWRPLPGVDLRTPSGPVVVERPGRHRLVVSLVRDDGVGVVVSRG